MNRESGSDNENRGASSSLLSIVTENIILGSLIQDISLFSLVLSKGVIEDDFYILTNKKLFSELRELYSHQSMVDGSILPELLRKRNTLDDCGGEDKILSLANSVYDTENFEGNLGVLQDKSKMRKLGGFATKILDSINKGIIEENVSEQFFSILSHGSNLKIFPFTALLREEFDKHFIRNEIRYISSGFPNLDKKISGFFPGEATVIAARPGGGKTAFALNLASNFIKMGKRVLFLNLEMTNAQMFQRMMALICNIPINLIRSKTIPKDNELVSAEKLLKNEEPYNRLFIADISTGSVRDVESATQQAKIRYNIDVVIIDHLQLLKARRPTFHRFEDLSNICIELKTLCRRLNIVGFFLSQISRAGATSNGVEEVVKRPSMENLKSSGGIEENFDNVFILQEVRNNSKRAATPDSGLQVFEDEERIIRTVLLDIVKQRNGELAAVYFQFNAAVCKFSEL